jgi:hypothetical protein
MRTNCAVCNAKLSAEVTKSWEWEDPLSGQTCFESESRELKADKKYNKDTEIITDVWCPDCGIKYKFIND